MTADPPSAHRTFFDQVSAAWHTSTDGLLIGAGAVGLYQLVIWLRLRFLQPSLPGGTGLWVAVNVLIVLSLVARRRWPLAVTALTSVAMAVTGPPGLQAGMFAPLLVSVYALVSLSGTLQRVVGLGLAVLGACGPDPLVDSDLPLQTRILSKCLILVVVAAVALLLRSRRRALELSDARLAAQAAGHRLAAQRDTARRQARVAGELHDSVGHALTAIIALSEGLRDASDDATVNEAVDMINSLAREGLADTRSAVASLAPPPRCDGGGGAPDGVPRQPAPGAGRWGRAGGGVPGGGVPHKAGPGLGGGMPAPTAREEAPGEEVADPRGWGRIDTLLTTVRGTGLSVLLAETGRRPEDPGLGRLVFTLSREVLTNVMRHATGATRVVLALDHGPQATVLTVSDDGCPAGGAPGADVLDGKATGDEDGTARAHPAAPGAQDGAEAGEGTRWLTPAPQGPGVGLPREPASGVGQGTGPGAPAAATGTGHGLAHLRALVAEHGGTLSAGPVPDGWRLQAVVPRWETRSVHGHLPGPPQPLIPRWRARPPARTGPAPVSHQEDV